MITFRKKILFADIVLFLMFLALLFPFVETMVHYATHKTLIKKAADGVNAIKNGSTFEEVEEILNQPRFFFEPRRIFDLNGDLVWQSEAYSNPVIPHQSAVYVQRVLKEKVLYEENYIAFYQQTFAHIDQLVVINGETYILRTGFPLHEIQDVTITFEVGFLAFGTFMLLLYSLITWIIINRITWPIQQIIDAIVPYQEGREEFLPRIHLHSEPSSEFTKLAFTLSSLSERIQKQIDSLKQQRDEIEGILESLGEGVIALNSGGKITFANAIACQILSAPHEMIISHSLDEVASRYPDLLFRCSELVLQVLQTSEPIVQTWTQERGARLYLHLVAAPLAGQNGAILVLQDKTSDYKVLEMGRDFIANASHELRTPITVIRGFAETLQDFPEISPKMLQEISEKIVRTSIRLEKLVKSLLTLSDIENLSKAEFQAADIIPIIQHCKTIQLTVHPEASIDVHSDQPRVIVSVDPDIFEMAIMNLIDNGIKYSTPPASIEVRIRSKPSVSIEVEDKGIGIPDADIPHIFDRFYTVDKARSRKSGGAGLGLSIVRTIIEKHGAHIAVTSHVGKGTRFTITFPHE